MNFYPADVYKSYPQRTIKLSTHMIKDELVSNSLKTQLFMTIETKL